MNLVTSHIYNRTYPDDSLLSPAIQLAIINRVNSMVDRVTGTKTITACIAHTGEIVCNQNMHMITDVMYESGLLDSLRNWNNRRTTNTIKLDDATISLAKAIELEFQHPSGKRHLTQANIAAYLLQTYDQSVILFGDRIDTNVQVLFDETDDTPLYIGQSKLGSLISQSISNTISSNDSHADIHIIQAPQGAGKTNFLTSVVSDANFSNQKVVCVSPRQQLITSMFNTIIKTDIQPTDILIGAANASRLVGRHKQRPSDEYDVTLTTINSMDRIWKFTDERIRRVRRLDQQLRLNTITADEYIKAKRQMDIDAAACHGLSLIPQQDLVVCDEFQLLRSTLMGGTHIDNEQAYSIRTKINHLEQNSKVTIVLDADIDSSTLEYFAVNHPNSKIHLHKFVSPEQREVHVHANTESLIHWLMNQISSLIAKTSIDQPASFMIPCTSTTTGRRLLRMIRSARPDLKTLWIESFNKNEREQKIILEDPSAALEYDIILYSPTIFTGFSFDSFLVNGKVTPVADRVVGMFEGKRITWMERSQALFRVRNCNELHFCIDPKADAESDAKIISNDVIEDRQQLFDCDGLRMPMPDSSWRNSNLILYFRSRGFHLYEHEAIDSAAATIKQLRSDTNRTTKVKIDRKPKKSEPVNTQALARLFVDHFIAKWQLPEVLDVGKYPLFEGELQHGFSKLLDQWYEDDATFEECIKASIPNWVRTYRYDMRVIQKMFMLADTKYEVEIGFYNARNHKGSRRNKFVLSLVVNPAKRIG